MGDNAEAAARPTIRKELEVERERSGGRKPAKALPPFNQGDRGRERILEAKLRQFGGIAEAVQIGMPKLNTVKIIALDERVAWTRNLFGKGERGKTRADQRAGKGGFAGAEWSRQKQAVSSAEMRRKCTAKRLGRRRVGKLNSAGHDGSRSSPVYQ